MTLGITKLSKRYGNEWVLKDVSFEAHENRIFGICGPPGSGKSTLLKLIAGETRSNGGTLTSAGVDITGVSAGSRNITLHSGQGARRNLFGAFSEEKISSGEKQVAAFEKAMQAEGKVLLLDDPFSMVDAEKRDRCFGVLKDFAAKPGRIVVFATSQFEQIAAVADDAGMLAGGSIVQIGTPSDIYDHPETAAVARMSGANNIFAARRITSTNAEMPEFQTLEGSHRIIARPVKKSRLGAINQNVMLAIRPEQVSMSMGASFPEDNLIKAVVTGTQFLGPTSLIRFDANGLSLDARVFKIVGLNHGDECMLGLSPNRISILTN